MLAGFICINSFVLVLPMHPPPSPLFTCAQEEISQNKILLKRQIFLQLAAARVSSLMFYLKVKEDVLIKRTTKTHDYRQMEAH